MTTKSFGPTLPQPLGIERLFLRMAEPANDSMRLLVSYFGLLIPDDPPLPLSTSSMAKSERAPFATSRIHIGMTEDDEDNGDRELEGSADDLLGLVPMSYDPHPDMDRIKRQLREKAKRG